MVWPTMNRRHGIIRSANLSVRRSLFQEMPKAPRRFFAKDCTKVPTTAGCCSVCWKASRPNIKRKRCTGWRRNSKPPGTDRRFNSRSKICSPLIDGDLIHDLDPERIEPKHLSRMVGQQPDGRESQIREDLRADAGF